MLLDTVAQPIWFTMRISDSRLDLNFLRGTRVFESSPSQRMWWNLYAGNSGLLPA